MINNRISNCSTANPFPYMPNVVLRSSLGDELKHLNVCHFNACSLLRKMHDVKRIVLNSKLNVICVTESWLCSSDTNKSVYLPGFTSFRNDRPSRGGGVLIYVKKRFNTKVICRSNTDGIEYIFIEVSCNNLKVLIACVYIPKPTVALLKILKDELKSFNNVYSDILILGDFNIDILNSSNLSRKYLNILDQLSLTIINTIEPTHFVSSTTTTSTSLIDHIIVSTSRIDQVIVNSQINGISHHDLIYLSYNIPQQTKINRSYVYRDFKNCDLQKLFSEVQGVSWREFYNFSDIDKMTEFFNSNLTDLYDRNVPLRTFKPKLNHIPWYDPAVEISLVERDIAFSAWTSSKTLEDKLKYKRLRNYASLLIRRANRKYGLKVLNPKLDGKKLWNNLGKIGITDESDINSTVPFLPEDINSFFLSTQTDSQVTANNCTLTSSAPSASFSFYNITPNDTISALLSIKSNSSGSDNIAPKFIRLILHLILPQINYLFNSILTKSVYPKCWKLAKVIPFQKKSSPNLISDYRPISLLPYFSKALEKVMKIQICKFIDENKLLIDYQSGFRPMHSTCTALLKVTTDIRKALEDGQLALLVLLDFSKAFDCIKWDFLLRKLQNYGFSTSAIKLMQSYFTGPSSS